MTDRDILVSEVGPRDGLQNEKEIISTGDKLGLITHMLDAGVEDFVEIAPRAVLTNMHIDLDYAVVEEETPDHITPAYDGMVIRYSL